MTLDNPQRRVFCAAAGAGAVAVLGSRLSLADDPAQGQMLPTGPGAGLSLVPARWYKAKDAKRIECGLCPRACRVADRERGTCGVRENRDGKYYTLVHSRPCVVHLDPIEKKPFFHVLPGQSALSLAAPGCNLECKFCQNWEIAQVRPEQVPTTDASPGAIVELARHHDAPTIACTYSEPVVWSEYVYDIAAAAKPMGIRTLLVSNGFIQTKPMTELLHVLGAVKIDLKAFTEDFYRNQCRGQLQPVLDTLRLLAKKRTWTEIVVLVIPSLNDSEREIRRLARFVHDEMGPEVPLHLTRFHPSYRLTNVPSTPVKTLDLARHVAMDEGLHFVYVGNVLGHPGNHTYCPGCNLMVIRRLGISVVQSRLDRGRCPSCHRAIPGIWS